MFASGRRKARESPQRSPFRLDLDLNKHMCLDMCAAHAKVNEWKMTRACTKPPVSTEASGEEQRGGVRLETDWTIRPPVALPV